jgi:release factor glutamine methyltransferase
VLDLCTGSGAVAIALKNVTLQTTPQLEVWAADISPEALATARANAARIPGTSSIHFCQGNLYEALPALCFNLIVSNPPYVPHAEIAGLSPEVRAEPLLALDGGSDGLDLIRTIIARAPEFLCPGGSLLLEADPRQMSGIASLLAHRGFTDIRTCQDLSGRERVIGGKLRKN